MNVCLTCFTIMRNCKANQLYIILILEIFANFAFIND